MVFFRADNIDGAERLLEEVFIQKVEEDVAFDPIEVGFLGGIGHSGGSEGGGVILC